MKKTSSIRLILGAAVLAYALIGDCLLQAAGTQAQVPTPPATQLVSTPPGNASAAGTSAPDIDPKSPLGQIVSLVQAGVEQSVILNYITNSTGRFNLDADKIIYLNDLGVPTEIINAMMEHDQQLQQTGATPSPSAQSVDMTETTAQPTEVTVNYFYDTLAPYGTWLNVAGYGWCWRPTVVIYDAGWQPYCNNGHWVYTNPGWYWMSGYSWGWATFHYGRWFRLPRYGWCWWPDTTWAPSWVCWRYNGNYCGWAPLPPYAVYRSGVGFFYNGHVVGSGFTFGLSASAFTFVPTRDFCGLQPWRHRVGEKEAARIYHRSRFFHNMDFDHRDRVVMNPGIPPHDITAVTKQPIHPVAVHYETGGTVRGKRHEQFEHGGRALIVKRPHFVGSRVLTLHRGATPAPQHRQNEIRPGVRGNANGVLRHPSNPARPNDQRHELNQNQHLNYNRGTVRTPQAKPANPPRQNEFQLNVYRNNNGVSSHSGNAGRNDFRRPEVNRGQSQPFNRANPQTPAHRQSEVPHVITPRPEKHDNAGGAPHSTQNRPTYRNYHSPNRVLSPRSRGFEQQAPHMVSPASPPQRTVINRQHEQRSSAPTRHFSPPSEQRQTQRHYVAPRNESRQNVQRFNRSASQPHVVQPHPGYHSPSASSSRSGNQNRDQGKKGR